MALRQVARTAGKWTGLSTDTKPTIAIYPGEVGNGSTLLETDTGDLYFTADGTNWVIKDWFDNVFGEPTLISNNRGDATWVRPGLSPYNQRGGTGWLANLYGGVQSGVDWAGMYIPVDEMKLPVLSSAIWTYYLDTAQSYGVNIVIWVRDPNNHNRRAEITQLGSISGLAKGVGQNAHTLDITTDQFFWYGEDWSTGAAVALTGSGLTSGPPNYYGLDDFQADALFAGWEIYRISIENGWESSGTFGNAWIASVEINGQTIPIKPDRCGSGRIGHRRFEIIAGAISETLSPKTPYRLLSLTAHVDNIPVTTEVLTLTVDDTLAGGTDAAHFAVLLMSEDMFAGSRTSLFVPFGEGYDFDQHQDIDIAQANGDDDDWGIVIAYQTVFGDV